MDGNGFMGAMGLGGEFSIFLMRALNPLIYMG